MFTKFHIKNFRTHIDTEINLKDLTLIIGSNNSGKTNLLEAISFFAELVRRGMSEKEEDRRIDFVKDYSDNFHASGSYDYGGFCEDMLFSCSFSDSRINIDYSILIKHTSGMDYECNIKETLVVNGEMTFTHEEEAENDGVFLNLYHKMKEDKEKPWYYEKIYDAFMLVKYYNFQPILLKNNIYTTEEPVFLNSDGSNLQALLKQVKQKDSTLYNRFVGLVRRFEPSFVGLDLSREGEVLWQFDMGNNNFPAFPASKISEGLLKASAIAILIGQGKGLIMIEEIENGINQTNIRELLEWLRGASNGGKNMQFILTTHSPSVIREFADRTDCVYNVHLRKKKGYISEVSNLSDALKTLIKFGAIKEETVVEDEGVVKIRPYALTEMFYDGVLGSL